MTTQLNCTLANIIVMHVTYANAISAAELNKYN